MLADVVRLNRQLAMFVAPIDQHGELHASRPAKINQLIQRGANRAAGVQNVVNQNDVAVFNIPGKFSAADDWLCADRRKVVAIKSDVQIPTGGRVPSRSAILSAIRFGQRHTATTDANQKQIREP